MAADLLDHVLRYATPSSLVHEGGRPSLALATSGGADANPHFFTGRLADPRRTAMALRALARVASERFYIPPGMLERILAASDPVVTSGGGHLRFEAFSACCSTYARVDLPPDAIDGEFAGHGTTNVDFNAPMRAALAQAGDHDELGLRVGADHVILSRDGADVTERRVPLPSRWLRSFVEVQAYQARMERRAALDRAAALSFVRSLPASAAASSEIWAVPSGRGLRIAGSRSPGAVRITGAARLRLLEPLAAVSGGLEVLATPDGEASEWVLALGPARFHLVTSADASRGFSGEGQALDALSSEAGRAVVASVRSVLRWQAVIQPESLARETGLAPSDVSAALAILGSCGLVGFDVTTAAHFHRELPFDLSKVEGMHPRLAGARRLIDTDGVRIVKQSGDHVEAEVAGSGVAHRVTIGPGGAFTCTCTWHSRHRGTRGPCKHVVALRLASAT